MNDRDLASAVKSKARSTSSPVRMFVKRRRNLNINNNDMFLNRNYDKVLSEVGTDKNGNNNNNENGEVNFTEGNLMISK